MFALMLAALAIIQTPVCAPPPGAEQLWTDPVTRFAFIGETHGVAETPAAFAELACEASASRPVMVALEMPVGLQPALDAWMASDGGVEAKAALLAHDFFLPARADGRTSQAMLTLLVRLNALKAGGRDLTLRAFRADGPTDRRAFDQSYLEIEIANRLVHIAYERPDALVLVLGGAMHARKTVAPTAGFLFAAGHLKPADVRSLRIANQGGRVWACFETCGETDLGEGDVDPALRGVIMEAQDDGAWDGLLALGPTTASPPAMTGTTAR